MIGEAFAELLKLIGVLLAVVVGYILSGIANSVLVKGECFDTKKLITGIAKAIIACAGLCIVAYIFTIIDLSSLGFQPKTAISSGILVYAGKLIKNAMGLLGLNLNGKEESDIMSCESNKKEEDESCNDSPTAVG